MISGLERRVWDDILSEPLDGRVAKPREVGLTMVIDRGLGLDDTRCLLELASDHIDYWKLAFGTSVLYPAAVLREKIKLVREYDVAIYPGGTLLEVANHQGRRQPFLDRAVELGFTHIEVSDGTIQLDPGLRELIIKEGRSRGLGVLTEVGKKDRGFRFDATWAAKQTLADLEAGAEKVIIESRASGKGIGIYGDDGSVLEDILTELVREVGSIDNLIFEAPQVKQQQYLLIRFGPNVNFGNVKPEDVITLECNRRGLRSDTFRLCLENELTEIQ